jgi:hypothetical protein
MKDLIRAIRGKTCDWCFEQPPSPVDRLFRLDQCMPHSERRWHEMLVMSINNFWTRNLPIWKLGRWWHYKFHYVRKEN